MWYQPDYNWFIDYNDLATQTTALSYVSGELVVTNDWAWPYSNYSHSPKWVTQLWNTAINKFDFSQLRVWDEVTVRTDWTVVTSAINQEFWTKIRFDIWWSPFDLSMWASFFKSVGAYPIIRQVSFYIGTESMRANPAELLFSSSDPADLVVNWFYMSVRRKY